MAVAGMLLSVQHQPPPRVLEKTSAEGSRKLAASKPVKASLASATTTYTVSSGDTLSAIALRFYGDADYWPLIAHANKIADPNYIVPGEGLEIPHAGSHVASSAGSTESTSATSALSGTLSCPELKGLWEQAGGSQGEAFMAAEIAMAESSGEEYATSPAPDYAEGYWQILPSAYPTLATYNPLRNAEAAVQISDDGQTWTRGPLTSRARTRDSADGRQGCSRNPGPWSPRVRNRVLRSSRARRRVGRGIPGVRVLLAETGQQEHHEQEEQDCIGNRRGSHAGRGRHRCGPDRQFRVAGDRDGSAAQHVSLAQPG